MENFNYRIYNDVYDAMVKGDKTIEIRLYNEKSKQIKIGDIIKFNILDSNKYLLVKVTNLYKFKNIDELWPYKNKILTTFKNLSKEEFVTKLNDIFGTDEVKSHELIGIEFNII